MSETVTRKTINWGAVVKGAAIIAAVVVVAAVGFVALQALAAAALATPAGASAAATAIQIGTPIANGLQTAVAFLGQLHPLAWVSSFFAPIGQALGFSATALSATQAAAVTQAASIAGAGAATALAAPIAGHHLGNLNFTHTVTVPLDPSAHALHQTTHAAQMMEVSHLSHMTHHAAEHTHNQDLKLRPKAANWQEYVGKPQPQAAAAPAKSERRIEKPQADFAGDLNKQRAELEASLGQKIL